MSKLINLYKASKIFLKRTIRKIKGQSVVYIVGDSHSLLFKNELFDIRYIGPATAFKLGDPISTTNSRSKILKVIGKLPISKTNVLMFVFGEIDCRIHIFNKSKKNKILIDTLIEKTAKNYVKFINELSELFPNNKYFIFNILPPGEQNNIYNTEFYPSRRMALQITKKTNNRIKILVTNLNYIDIFDHLIDKKGNRLPKYKFDEVHYNDKIIPLVIKELKIKGVL